MISALNDKIIEILGKGDERVENWPMVKSPLPTLAMCLTYAAVVKVIGPRLMKNREPFSIRWLMVFYNLSMVVVSTWIWYKLGKFGWFGKYNYCCQPVDYSDSEDAIGMATFAYYYYLTKFIEFADTLFFVMRKKNNHITNLHVIHHGIMPMSVWWGIRFTPGGHSTFFAFLNSFVHILMYIYYGLSAIGPQMNKYLFWKKYMTAIQMVQFIAIFVHSFQLLFRSCDYPKSFMWWIGFHAVLFWFLFWDFFVVSYTNRRKSKFGSFAVSSAVSIGDDNEINTKNSRAIDEGFFSCSPTQSFIDNMNDEDEESTSINRKTSSTGDNVSRRNKYTSQLMKQDKSVRRENKDL